MSHQRSASAGSKGRNPLLGLWFLLFKVGGKVLPTLAKLLKGLKFGKIGLAGASFGAYAVLFSWQFAALILGSIFFHEMGHVWAMKRCGMKTKGIYFIPLLGAAAVADEAFKSRKDETFIALMGPIWGFGLAVIAYAAFLATGEPLAAAVAGWMAMINLFNLLPINPLDGGRVMKSVAYSIHSKLGYGIMLAMFGACFVAAYSLNLGLIWFLMIFGGLELLGERRRMQRNDDRESVAIAFSKALGGPREPEKVADRLEDLASGWDAMSDDERRVTNERIAAVCKAYGADTEPPLFSSLALQHLAFTAMPTRHSLILRRPYKATSPESLFGIDALVAYLRERNIPTMTPKETALGFGAYLGLGVLLLGLMYACASVPSARAALSVFMD